MAFSHTQLPTDKCTYALALLSKSNPCKVILPIYICIYKPTNLQFL